MGTRVNGNERQRLGARRLLACVAVTIVSFVGVWATPAAVWAAETEKEAEVQFDPFEGMDADGRIPKVEKANLVDRPERWRYLPESRMPKINKKSNATF